MAMENSLDISTPFAGRFIFPALVCIAAIVSTLTANLLWMVIPMGILFIWTSIEKPHWIYYLLLCSIPFSTEMDLPGGLATDFPDEPLMWWIFVLGLIYVMSRRFRDVYVLFRHPLSWVLLFHWVWILLVSVLSSDFLLSFKYWLSKTWYLFVFYVMAFVFFKNQKRLRWFALTSILAAALTVVIIEFRHGLTGFAFNTINVVVRPFYRNHVNYACLIVCVLPYFYPLVLHFYKKGWIRNGLILTAMVLLTGITFAYTRAAYLALLSILIFYPILKLKLLNFASISALVVVSGMLIYYSTENRYLELAPDYNQAITHTDFGSLLEATPQGKDISTMERLYRWVAGIRMTSEKVMVGYGPSTFFQNYPPFTLRQFATYVSDNPDRSTIHNYYLMTAVEQGIPGLFIFLAILFVYFKTAQESLSSLPIDLRAWAIASIWSTAAILVILLFNDMIETDKVGSYFLINLAILVRLNQFN